MHTSKSPASVDDSSCLSNKYSGISSLHNRYI